MNEEKTKAKTIVCSNCGGQLDVDGLKENIECPYCGTAYAVSELLNESDAVKIEKIKRDVKVREQEIIEGELQHQREKEKIQEENNTIAEFKKSKFAKLLIGVSIFGALMCAVAFNDEKILAGVIGIIITGLSICSYLMGVKAINEPKKGVRTLAAVAAFVLIIPYFAAYNSYDEYTYSDFAQYEKNRLNELKQNMSKFEWPDSEIADLLPKPKSDFGHIEWETSSGFVIYVGKTTLDEYNEYVKACRQSGFTVDYDKGDSHYYAKNSEGYDLDLKFEGENIMFIRIDEPGTWDEDDTEDESFDKTDSDEIENEDFEDETKKTDSEDSKNSSSNSSSSGISADFKAAMDSYEKFFDEYVAIMKKYANNPNDMSILGDYTKYIGKYAQMMEDFEKWEDEDMNAAETAYYLEVQGRITKKLANVAQ